MASVEHHHVTASQPVRTEWWRTSAATFGTVVGLVFASLILALGPSLATLVFAGAWLVAGAFSSAELGVVLIIASVALLQREQLFSVSVPLAGGGLKPTDILLFATLAGWLLRRLLRRVKEPGLRSAASRLLVAFLLWAAGSAVLGLLRGHFYKNSLLELRPLLMYALLFPIAAEFDVQGLRRLATLIKLLAVVVGLRTVALYALGAGEIATYAGDTRRITEVNFVLLLLGFLLSASALFFERRHRLLSALVAILTLIALAVTFQRAAFVGIGVAFAGVLALQRGAQRWGLVGRASALALAAVIVLGGVGGVAGTNVVGALGTRLASILDYGEDVSAQHRRIEWATAFAMVRERPLTGHGLGARVQFYSPMYDPETKKSGYWSDDIYVHNSYVWFLVKMGAIGFILFLATVTAGLARLARAVSRDRASSDLDVRVGLFAGLLALLTVSVFGPMANVDQTVPFMVLLLGAAYVHRDEPRRSAGGTS